MHTFDATTTITINASAQKVWQALIDPQLIKQYMTDAEVTSDWQKGSPLSIKSRWNGTMYEDKGVIAEIDPPKRLVVDYASDMGTHSIAYELVAHNETTDFTITQGNNKDEESAEQARQTWFKIQETIKKVVESQA